jgi:glycosyltransferase involved in cell wall biosynthesis
MKRTVSVIVPSYNSFKTIEYTIKGLLSQPDGLIDEIIIVDSSVDDKTRPVLSKYESEKIRVIKASAGPGVARNIGVRHSKGDILVFIDSDAYPMPGWISNIIKAVEKGCVIGAGSIAVPEFQKKMVIATAQLFLQYNEYMDAGAARIKPFVPSVTMFCDRKLFERFGGFPAIRAAEDVMFCLTVNKTAPVWFIPEIRVYHIFREDLKSFLNNQVLLGKYIIIYRRLHEKNVFYYKGLWPLIFLPGFILIKLWRITRRILNSNPRLMKKFIRSLPMFLVGLGAWTAGFAQGIFLDEKKMIGR